MMLIPPWGELDLRSDFEPPMTRLGIQWGTDPAGPCNAGQTSRRPAPNSSCDGFVRRSAMRCFPVCAVTLTLMAAYTAQAQVPFHPMSDVSVSGTLNASTVNIPVGRSNQPTGPARSRAHNASCPEYF